MPWTTEDKKESLERYTTTLKAAKESCSRAWKEDAERQGAEAKKLLGKRLVQIDWAHHNDGGIQITNLIFEDGFHLKIWANQFYDNYCWIESKVTLAE